MKNKWILATLVLFSIVGAGTAIFFLVGPKPIPKIKMSSFESADMVANAIILRLNQEISSQSGFLFGVNPNEPFHLEVLEALKTELKKAGFDYQELSMNPQEFVASEFVAAVKKAKAEGKRVFAVATFVVASHFREDWDGDFLTVSLYPLPRSKFQEAKSPLSEQCTAEAKEPGKEVGCLALGEARKNYSKTMDQSKWTGLMSQVAVADYLFLLGREK